MRTLMSRNKLRHYSKYPEQAIIGMRLRSGGRFAPGLPRRLRLLAMTGIQNSVIANEVKQSSKTKMHFV